ncbi:MAG: toll/interleukin-1 receptor domain-containing protein [Bryobacteraceae bacterium]
MRLKHACFVSYRHGQYDLMKEFTSDFCSALCGELEPLLGTAGVFLDQQRLEGGSFYNEALARDLFDSATMAMVYTPTYFDSDHTFCTREFRAMEALEKRRLERLGLPLASTNGLIIPVVLRGARYLPGEIRNTRQYYNFESFLLGGRRLSRHPKFAPAIREMAGYICTRYYELSRLPDEEFLGMDEFRLPDDHDVKPLLSMAGGFHLPFPRGASLCTSAAP